MSFHGTVERLTEERGTALYARRQRDELLGPDKAKRVAVRLVQEDRGAHRIGNGPDQGRVEKVNAHPARRIFDASQRREITVADGDHGILILVQGSTNSGQLF
jgi:hypothetical protein